MEQLIRDQFNDSVLHEALRRFGVGPDAKKLGSFENYVFEYMKDGAPYILRFSHSRRRSVEDIRGEIDWINYLKDGGLGVSRAVPSIHGNLVEVIGDAANYFSVVSFEKAPGQHVTKEDWRPEHFKKLGQYMGKMHALTKEYQPSDPAIKRANWDHETDFAAQFLPESDAGVVEKHRQLFEHFRQLPQDRDSFGLIHVDLHRGNYFVHNDGEIYAFDFDDSMYSWFVHDIAISLFYALPHHCETREQIEDARVFFENFMDGYSKEHTLDAKWLKEIPYFLKLREMVLYVVINRSCDLNNLDQWCASFMRNRKEKILHDVPYVDLDFTR